MYGFCSTCAKEMSDNTLKFLIGGKSGSPGQRSGSAQWGLVGFVVGLIALILGIIALVVALWKYGYWDAESGGIALISTSYSIAVEGFVNTLSYYMIAGFSVLRLAVIPLLPAPDDATIFGNLGITSNLQEAESYFLWRSSEPTTQPNNWFIDNYIQQVDAVFGTIGLNFFTMNGYFFMSDSDHKVNISAINGTAALEIVRAVDPSTFFWADDAEETLQFGFIAQNVNATFPEAVQAFGDAGGTNGTLGVSTIALLSQLWAAVKELDKQINP